MATSSDDLHFLIEAEHCGQRLDRFLTIQLPDCSRSYVAQLIRQGALVVNHARHCGRNACLWGLFHGARLDPRPRPPRGGCHLCRGRATEVIARGEGTFQGQHVEHIGLDGGGKPL